ncbi:GAF domain-containing protein [Kineococcus glutinatus]|uniref:GAF domain-containing protein n=1 Tax=Kineococcus glutinatus TaxID=1070872 RepID=A0ABP9H727_9ACTN
MNHAEHADHGAAADAAVPAWLTDAWAAEHLDGPSRDPLHEEARLAAVDALGADDVERVQPLTEDLLAGVSAGTGAPVGLLNVVLSGAQIISGAHGLTGWLAEARATPAEWALCATVVRTGEAYVVPDLTADAATADNPLAVVDGMRAYAGVPLRTSTGHVIGSMCVLDTEPREFSADDLAALEVAADEAVRRLEQQAGGGAEVAGPGGATS